MQKIKLFKNSEFVGDFECLRKWRATARTGYNITGGGHIFYYDLKIPEGFTYTYDSSATWFLESDGDRTAIDITGRLEYQGDSLLVVTKQN